MECEWQDWDDTLDEAQSTAEIPSFIRPFSEIEPVLSESELAELDYVADEFELARLSEMGVLSVVEDRLPDHQCLTTKYVRAWRPKVFK